MRWQQETLSAALRGTVTGAAVRALCPGGTREPARLPGCWQAAEPLSPPTGSPAPRRAWMNGLRPFTCWFSSHLLHVSRGHLRHRLTCPHTEPCASQSSAYKAARTVSGRSPPRHTPPPPALLCLACGLAGQRGRTDWVLAETRIVNIHPWISFLSHACRLPRHRAGVTGRWRGCGPSPREFRLCGNRHAHTFSIDWGKKKIPFVT